MIRSVSPKKRTPPTTYRSKSLTKITLPKNELRGPVDLDIIKKIGTGSYGDVFQAKLSGFDVMPDYFPPENNYALKKMLDSKLNRAFEYEQKIMNEIKIKFPKCSPHVLCYFDISIDKDGIYYLLSEMQEGDVKDLFKSMSKTQRKNIGYDILYQSLLGLQELKSVGLLHRDIKMDNILYKRIGKEVLYKLADFGLSCSEKNTDIQCGKGIYGTPAYISPKVLILHFSGRSSLLDTLWDETDDIYSLAATMYEFIFGEELMSAETYELYTEMYTSKQKQDKSRIEELVNMFQEQYEKASKKINNAKTATQRGNASQIQKVYNFILTNINPFEKKQTINQALQSLS
jgi:serine/threonine protein kinase